MSWAAVAGWMAWAAAYGAELPVYPGTTHTRIGNELLVNGERFRIAYFLTDDPMTTVAEYFFAEWKLRGYPTVLEGVSGSELVVSAFCTREGLQRSVVLRLHQGRTLGFAVLRDLRQTGLDGENSPPPSPEGALIRHDLVSTDFGRAHHVSTVVASKLRKTREKIIEQLGHRGYQLASESTSSEAEKRGITLEHTQRGKRVVTVLTELGTELTAVVQTWLGDPG